MYTGVCIPEYVYRYYICIYMYSCNVCFLRVLFIPSARVLLPPFCSHALFLLDQVLPSYFVAFCAAASIPRLLGSGLWSFSRPPSTCLVLRSCPPLIHPPRSLCCTYCHASYNPACSPLPFPLAPPFLLLVGQNLPCSPSLIPPTATPKAAMLQHRCWLCRRRLSHPPASSHGSSCGG